MESGSKLGFDKILNQNIELCTTIEGVAKLRDEGFSRDRTVILKRLRLCDEMRRVLMMEGGFPSGEYYDTVEIIRKAEVEGAFLEIEQILKLKNALVTVKEIKDFFKSKTEEDYPDLISIAKDISNFPEIINHVDSIVDRYGNIRDNASAELYSIRKSIRDRQGQISKRLQGILAEAQRAGIVDPEASLSIRDGRPVIPVSAANKRKLKGFIHDESATGKTFYIEPVEIVEVNNELRELEYQERREIIRILTVFTETIRPDLSEIERSGDYLTTMDMIRAKARFANKNGCIMPILSEDGTLELRSARHPLLEQALKKENRKIVPLDIKLTLNKHILIISGPNAGGKSVCLKTLGLLQWMLQCGMLIPALENSEMTIFDNIFIDIGDEQSIDNDLSTYSSHLLNMKQMLQKAGRNSLILIDEFGTGTEPVIGGAIAEALLQRFEGAGCYGVITTHYSNLKYYASNAKGVINGAMTFDVQNIQPLFKLEIGTPGSSFAIEIARKIGLPEDVIKAASEKAGAGHINIEKQLREIARDKRYWEQKRDRIRIADRKVEDLEKKYGEQLDAIKKQRSEILKQARAEAEKITQDANKQIENAIRTIKESQADKEKTRLVRRNIEEFREALVDDSEKDSDMIDREMDRIIERRKRREERKSKEETSEKTKTKQENMLPKTPEVGSKVKMVGQDIVGEVTEIKGKKAIVAFGQILTTVALEKLTVVSNNEYKKQARISSPTISVSTDISQRKLNFRREIDVRGKRAAEALEEVQDFVDNAIMVGASELRILHGKGTGALKEEIRRYLRAVDLVISAEDEHVDMGGAGITVVKLDL